MCIAVRAVTCSGSICGGGGGGEGAELKHIYISMFMGESNLHTLLKICISILKIWILSPRFWFSIIGWGGGDQDPLPPPDTRSAECTSNCKSQHTPNRNSRLTPGKLCYLIKEILNSNEAS